MRILVVGGDGTIGRPLCERLASLGEVVTAGRRSGDLRVDIRDADQIERMYQRAGRLDACICVAASGPMDSFDKLTEAAMLENMRGKLIGQMNLVLIGQRFLADGGCFVLTSGIFADEAWPNVTSGAVISGALHSFCLSAAIELPRRLRINVVSPGMVSSSFEAYGHLFPGMRPVPIDELVSAYVRAVARRSSGDILRVY